LDAALEWDATWVRKADAEGLVLMAADRGAESNAPDVNKTAIRKSLDENINPHL